MNDNSFVAPIGYVELDNDCMYSIDTKTTRSRETVVPKDDLAFYFNTYIEPKYGLGNINVSNVASFLKDLEMNWTKLTPELKDKVMNIMVDYIFKSGDYDFKNALLKKMEINAPQQSEKSKSTFGSGSGSSKETPQLHGILFIILAILIVGVIFFTFDNIM